MKRIYEHNDKQPILERLLQDKESSEIEFKSAAGGFTKSFWETYTSFVNTNGGAKIFGVKEKAGEFCLDGLTSEQVEKYKRDFFNNMHSKQNISIALLKEEEITNKRLQYTLDLHRTDITHLLNDMRKKGLLAATGYGRGTKYHVSGMNVGHNMDTSEANMELQRLNMDPSSIHNMDSSSPTNTPRLYNKEQLRERITINCTEWRTAGKITKMLGRNLKYIKNFILSKKGDFLEKMYEMPHHPRQKYRAKQSDK